MKSKILMCLFPILTTACLTRAPTEYELDKRAGFATPASPKLSDKEIKSFGSNAAEVRTTDAPPRRAPLVKKIWVYRQTIDNRVFDGTWMWVELDRGRWDFESNPEPKNQKLTEQTAKQGARK